MKPREGASAFGCAAATFFVPSSPLANNDPTQLQQLIEVDVCRHRELPMLALSPMNTSADPQGVGKYANQPEPTSFSRGETVSHRTTRRVRSRVSFTTHPERSVLAQAQLLDYCLWILLRRRCPWTSQLRVHARRRVAQRFYRRPGYTRARRVDRRVPDAVHGLRRGRARVGEVSRMCSISIGTRRGRWTWMAYTPAGV